MGWKNGADFVQSDVGIDYVQLDREIANVVTSGNVTNMNDGSSISSTKIG